VIVDIWWCVFLLIDHESEGWLVWWIMSEGSRVPAINLSPTFTSDPSQSPLDCWCSVYDHAPPWIITLHVNNEFFSNSWTSAEPQTGRVALFDHRVCIDSFSPLLWTHSLTLDWANCVDMCVCTNADYVECSWVRSWQDQFTDPAWQSHEPAPITGQTQTHTDTQTEWDTQTDLQQTTSLQTQLYSLMSQRQSQVTHTQTHRQSETHRQTHRLTDRLPCRLAYQLKLMMWDADFQLLARQASQFRRRAYVLLM